MVIEKLTVLKMAMIAFLSWSCLGPLAFFTTI